MAALLVLLGACAGAGGTQRGDSSRLQVVTSVYPFQFVADRIAGSEAEVVNLVAPGAEPHDLELSPRQVGAMAEADLLIYEKGFQPAVDEAVAQSGNQQAFDTTSVVPLERLAGPGRHDHAGAGGHEAGDHHEGGLDPHVWLDPTKLATIAAAVADRLAAVDPDQAGVYRANATRLERDLTELDEDFRSGLTGCQRTEFITSHTAFGYLAQRYRLTEIGITGLSPDAEPSPARIAEIQREAREHSLTTIFTETLVSPAVARAVAGDLGLRTDVLDPLEGLTPESRGADYLAIMRANLTALENANGCPRI